MLSGKYLRISTRTRVTGLRLWNSSTRVTCRSETWKANPFALKRQWASDRNCYRIVKDIGRLERFAKGREALDRKREIESALRKGTYIDPREGGRLFRDVGRAWLDGKTDIKARARSGYEALLKPSGDIDVTFGGYPVNAITRQHAAGLGR
jgi:hypothetical protein